MNEKLDSKTLADVQPGGRVRLATVPYDRARDLIGDAYNAGTHGIGYSQQAMELHDAILPAQPSPGGQGEARAQFEAWAESAGWYAVAYRPDRDAPYALNAVEFAWQAFQAALAARQPVGEPVRVSGDMVDGELSVASAIDQVVELFPSADRAALRTLAACFTHHSIYRYTAPPAQAVDLGQLRAKVESLTRRVEPIGGQRLSYVQLDDVLALIDSQA